MPGRGGATFNDFTKGAIARDFKEMAKQGRVQIVEEDTSEDGELIQALRYRRVRIG